MLSGRQNQDDHAGDNPALSVVIERNIRTLIQLRLEAARERNVQDRLADPITSVSGRMAFVYVHIVWFVGWVLLNTGHFGVQPFDPFPYGLLTMIVSLEAIFLSTFVLISQNRLVSHIVVAAEVEVDQRPRRGQWLVPSEASVNVTGSGVFLADSLSQLVARPTFLEADFPLAPSDWSPPFPYAPGTVRQASASLS